jgi:hypothetical protein
MQWTTLGKAEVLIEKVPNGKFAWYITVDGEDVEKGLEYSYGHAIEDAMNAMKSLLEDKAFEVLYPDTDEDEEVAEATDAEVNAVYATPEWLIPPDTSFIDRALGRK